MRKISVTRALLSIVACTFARAEGVPSVPTDSGAPTRAAVLAPAVTARLEREYAKIPLYFEANAGQSDARVRFLGRGRGYTALLTNQEAVLALERPAATGVRQAGGADRTSVVAGAPTIVRMELRGSNRRPHVTGIDELAGKVNYFLGHDSDRWRAGVPTYAKVRYRAVYPGIDVVYYGTQQQLEYDFRVAPGADPKRIRLAFSDQAGRALAQRIEPDGEVVVETGSGAVRLHRPVIYQDQDGRRTPVAGRYVILPGATSHPAPEIGLVVASYDRTRPLLIDPILSYSTYLGGFRSDEGDGIAVDGAGNAYVTGVTASLGGLRITPNAVQSQPGGGAFDAFVAKLNASGTAFVYSTYLGGSKADEGTGIAVDGAGNAYVTGTTESSNFPTTPNAFQSAIGGIRDSFVTKLNPSGTALVYSTYLGAPGGLGGQGDDRGRAIAVDGAGNAYVAGETNSPVFPITPNVIQPVAGGNGDGFVAKINAGGTALVYSTYLGGTSVDDLAAIAVDGGGNAYVTGDTESRDFPATPNAFQFHLVGVETFVTKVNADATAWGYSTFLGGIGLDLGRAIAVDGSGNAYVTGQTTSVNFPVTANAAQPTFAGDRDGFVTKVDASGSSIVYSTYLGGSGNEVGNGIAVDGAGQAYVTGTTASLDFPATSNAVQPGPGGGGYDAFVTKLAASGTALVYSTYLGGSGQDFGNAIAVGGMGAYVTGNTGSLDFPVLNALQPHDLGDFDAFVAQITEACTPGQTRACGNCGTQTLTAACTWSACGNQGVCAPGQTSFVPCGNCGARTDTCSNSCQWIPGVCVGQGECSPGEAQLCCPCGRSACSCAGEQVCGQSCTWGSCSGYACGRGACP